MADDLGRETIGAFGGRTYATPNLDRLAERGVRFDRAYTTPVCTPTRIQIVSGQYPFRTGWHKGLWDFQPEQKRMSPDLPSFARILREAGYATAIAGKYQLADTEVFPDHPETMGFDQHCLFAKTSGGHNRYWNPEIVIDGEYQHELRDPDVFGPDIYSGFLQDFIREQSEAGRPWLAYYSMTLPHGPFIPTPDQVHDNAERFPPHEPEKEPQQARRWYGGMVHYMDVLVGNLIQTLEETGELDNTLIVFTADNGTPMSVTSLFRDEAVRGNKGLVTEAGTRVPLILAGPGVLTAGALIDDLACTTDVLPTLVDAAGLELPEGQVFDGRSLLPLAAGAPPAPRDWVWTQWQGNVGIRGERYRLINGTYLTDMAAVDYNGRLVPPGEESPEAAEARAQLQAVYDEHWGTDGRNGRSGPSVPEAH